MKNFVNAYAGLSEARLSETALQERCAALAEHRSKDGGRRFPFQLWNDRRALFGAYRRLREQPEAGLSPGGEHFVDEYYVIERSLLSAEEMLQALPKNLPVTAEGERAGLPRIYNIAVLLVSATGARVGEAAITAGISAFQSVEALRMAELWALPLMLRIALLKRLRLLGEGCLSALRQYRLASEADAALQRAASALRRDAILEGVAPEENPILTERLLSLLTERDAYGEREKLCAMLHSLGQSPEGITERSRSMQEADAGAIRGAIASLKFLDSLDYSLLFEKLSPVDAILREDPIYQRMDGPSRGGYRDAAARLAARLHVAETSTVRAALELAQGREGKEGHAGYYLTDRGEAALAARLRPDKRHRPPSENRNLARFAALQAVLLLPLLLLSALGDPWRLLAVFLPAWAVACHWALRLLHHGRPLRRVPRLKGEYVEDTPVLVLLPVLTCTEGDVEEALGQLEAHYLANPLPNASFGVLGDFKDTTKPDPSMERALIRGAAAGVEALNRRYGGGRFYYLQRKQRYIPGEGLHMGYERKRGAIMAILKLLRAKTEAELAAAGKSFAYISAPLPDVEYCLTLDADTVLPNEALYELLGAAAHPLNRPELDEAGLVQAGYGVIVPAMRPHATGAARSPFSRMVSGEPGMSSYTVAAGEFYQDVFATGIFGGKGLFHVEALWQAGQHVPENTVLSHDLLEGCLARAGFMGDVALYDGEPANFLAWWKRAHRWIRGDWQLAPFLLPRIQNSRGETEPNPLSPLARYKILDNLRSSLVLPSVLHGIFLMPLLGYGFYIIPLLLPLFLGILGDCAGAVGPLIRGRLDLRRWRRREGEALLRLLTELCTLPYGAFRSLDAALRSLYRAFVSHRRMLEWQTAAQGGAKPQSLGGYYRALLPCPLAAGYMVASFFFGRTLLLSTLFALLFLAGPVLVKFLDQPFVRKGFSGERREALMEIAQATWKYFETYATEATGFLPPDNVQETPAKEPVYNTSPTNMGMGLLASVAAYDLGFLSPAGLLNRAAGMLDAMEDMEKWKGHLYNWYSLKTMGPLEPRYVSTVDSGNLAASLLLAEEALLHLPESSAAPGGKSLAARCRRLALDMDFRALYDEEARLFYIGYDPARGGLGEAHYDLLASEARLTSLFAVAFHQVEKRHWFALGRLLTDAPGGRALLSWSGTMFEYLMPLLFTGLVPGTLLAESCASAVETQRLYRRGGPWGISESGYYAFDRAMYYQYRAFGVPRLGLAPVREGTPLVIAPYASALALPLCPEAADNLMALKERGMLSAYGMYEALDLSGEKPEMVRSFMAHHQGMSLCAIDNALLDGALARRFMAVPEIHASRMLLEECPAPSVVIRDYRSYIPAPARSKKGPLARRARGDALYPESQLLGNGDYMVFITEDGLGYSQSGGYMLTRFRPDGLRSDSGLRIFLKGEGTAAFEIAGGEAEFLPSLARLSRRMGDVLARVEIAVSPEYRGEIRDITVTNLSEGMGRFTIGAFGEVALAGAGEDRAHPAFCRLRVDAERAEDVLLFHRRSEGPWLYLALGGAENLRFSTDGLQFPGRGRNYREAMEEPLLPGLDLSLPVEPLAQLRGELRVKGGMSGRLRLVMGLGDSREQAIAQAQALLRDGDAAALAAAHADSALRFSGLDYGKANLFERMAMRLILALPEKGGFQAPAGGGLALPRLWRLGISGDAPMVLFFVENSLHLRMAKSLMELASYLEARHVGAEVVIVGEYALAYENPLQRRLMGMQSAHPTARLIHAYSLEAGDREALRAAAMLLIDPLRSLDRQFLPARLSRAPEPGFPLPLRQRAAFAHTGGEEKLLFASPMGGFDPKSGEYCIRLRRGEHTPLPWCNILANPDFGTIVTESGGGHTWFKNSRLGKLSPWYNDPRRDPLGEALLVMDGEDGAVWTLSPGRLQGEGVARVRHGFGYTRFQNDAEEIRGEYTVFADHERPIKYGIVKLQNPMMRSRRLKLLYMCEWVLGEYPHPEAIAASYEDGLCRMENCREGGMGGRMAMLGADRLEHSFDRLFVLNGGYDAPSLPPGPGMGTAFSALRGEIRLEPGESRCLVLCLCPGEGEAYCKNALQEAEERLRATRRAWEARLSALWVDTGDMAMDLMLNYYLPYQIRAARLYARCGYYQCGGATGFRDQLQDALALKLTEPGQLRKQILFSAARQFRAGDVLHWWHQGDRGVRTDIRDDRLFLPYAVLEYIEATGERDILLEPVPYLKEAPIPQGQRSLYAPMEREEGEGGSLYAHCVAAIESQSFGAHGLPHMGGGDWNDAMDLVGRDGGESVWLGWFLLHILERFAPLAGEMGEAEYAEGLAHRAAALRKACEAAYDGGWYRRAYYGDGSPLGSQENGACAIDCISQAWAAINGAVHGESAMDALERMLLDEENGLLRLLTPPFEGTEGKDPGYIRDYLPGVRENGGQYTHAAAWAILGAAALKREKLCDRLFAMLNPISHTETLQGQKRYKAEPYVAAGDVYAEGRLKGRAGWSWYTGAAAWLYIGGVEHILGLRRQGDSLRIAPCTEKRAFAFRCRLPEGSLHVRVEWAEDGCPSPCTIPLEGVRGEQKIHLRLRW